jgi:hypothetical protein
MGEGVLKPKAQRRAVWYQNLGFSCAFCVKKKIMAWKNDLTIKKILERNTQGLFLII